MFSTKILIETIVVIIYSIVIGIAVLKSTKKMISKRSDDPLQSTIVDEKKVKIPIMIIMVISSVAIVLTQTTTELMIRNLLLLFPIFSVSIVDALIRKIPNSMLLTMIGIQAVYATYFCVSEKSAMYLATCAFGFFIGFAACAIPSMLKIPVGAGDIKYSGVIGLCIAFMGYFQAMVLMAIFVFAFYLALKIKKKGSLKTQIPMGPFLSVGTVITMCFPIIQNYAGDLGKMF